MRKTKIVCTLGPASSDISVIRKLAYAGMDVARFNFSHGDHAQHKATLDNLVTVREELNLPIGALLDTRGPEIRTGILENGLIELKKGQQFILSTTKDKGNQDGVSITYPGLADDLKPTNRILLDDGLIELYVDTIINGEIICTVHNDGQLKNSKGINVPGVSLSLPFISEKDKADIVFGIENGFDFIAASFTRNAQDILEIRHILKEYDCNSINLIAKIENLQGVENIDEIIRVSNGVMIARGDLGVEIPLEEVPVVQKKIIKKVYTAGKSVITATQMLDSMSKNPRPTRAEATDVANAIYDGTSAIMLSGETASGLYPVEAVETMSRLALRTEKDIDYVSRFKSRDISTNSDITNAISHATCTTAHDLRAAAIITVTKSGRTARMISKYRPACDIIGCCTYPHICRQLNLSWGVKPLLIDEESSTDDIFDHSVDEAMANSLIKSGELAVITAGVPLGISGTTNMLKVHIAGHILISGNGIGAHKIRASLCVCPNPKEIAQSFKAGDILVVHKTDNEMLPYLKDAAGIITEVNGLNSHGAIVGLSLDIPVIIGAGNATKILKSGSVVEIDPIRGVVSCNTESEE